jgi:hypothetical protein
VLTLDQTLAQYLRRIEQHEPQSLGKAPRRVTDEDNQFLRESLNRQLRFNNYVIVVAVILLCCLFLLGVFLIIHDRNSVNAVTVISGTTFAALLGIIGFLRRLWLDKSIIDLLIHATYGMSPAESAKLVTSLYFKSFDTRLRMKAKISD